MQDGTISNDGALQNRLFLIGFDGGFPEVLKRLLHDEYPAVESAEFATINEADADLGPKPSLILLDEVCCEELATQTAQLKQKFSRAMVAVAFNGQSPSANCLNVCMGGGVVNSFLPMDMRVEVWLAAIGLMLKGGRYVSPSMLDMLMDGQLTSRGAHTTSQENTNGLVKEIELLTPRELEVLDLVARGQQNKIIAADLGLSENTVKLHLHHIITKLNASNRTEASACYHAHMAAVRANGGAR